MTEDAFYGTPDYNLSSEQRRYLLANSDSGRTGSSSANFNPELGITNLAVALEKFKQAFNEKRIGGTKSTEGSEALPSQKQQASPDGRDGPAEGARQNWDRPRPDLAYEGATRVLSHQRSAAAWNARRVLARKGHSSSAIGGLRPRTNQLHARAKKVAVRLDQGKQAGSSQGK